VASVTISVGDISVGYEDEDEDAKSLNRLAEKTIERLVEKLTKEDGDG
jgi:hypothetical protein